MDNDMENTGAKVAAGEVLAVPPKCAVRSVATSKAIQEKVRVRGWTLVELLIVVAIISSMEKA